MEWIIEFTVSDESKGGKNGNPTFPEAVAGNKSIQERPWVVLTCDFMEGFASFEEVLAYHSWCWNVNKVPIIDCFEISHINLKYIFFILFLFELILKNNQPNKSFLMYFAI